MRALLLHPEFRSASFWNYRETCGLLDARYPAAPLGLCTVAALLPQDWELRLVDRNVESLDDATLAWADVVLIGAMLPQQRDCLDLIRRARALGKRVVVGGPDPTSSPHVYDEATHLVLGEGEITIPTFIADLTRGEAKHVYQDGAKADMSCSPVPRFDLLRLDLYNHVGIQFCRGCPFNCEFCDIIELYGRRPRAKTPEQIFQELQTLHDLGYRGHVDLVDDNFIGNKKLVKELLPKLKVWLEERDWPFEFTTEASINLADDPALMEMMRDVGFFAIFVGIESPDEKTLVAMQKRQNTRRPITESIEKIYAHGMFVNAGFIIGFDSEQDSVARGIIECIEDAAIPASMVGLLYALPNTQLTRRLTAEGRLNANHDLQPDGESDQCTAGINFAPRRPRADILGDYLKVVETVYAPDKYFPRVLRAGKWLNSRNRRYKPSLMKQLKELRGFVRLATKMSAQKSTRAHFWKTLGKALVSNPGSIRYTVSLMALYLHFGPFSQFVSQKIRQAIDEEQHKPSRVASAA
ncbi:B12-binding domain-containing radical SAM protein [Pyxidicoccus parkwayensis]|uniref:B12-binding domain-containing radical SAM protein n=1 Tax=Pyxidicoccus parkwayensis TaxID=2813578 RepID=A0ABX7P0R2_9BACT|nr:B12-binding domain-containing radical SAM protein [Pyxidicoccus parkwaysis]QSQ23266.1 B12-binding domain-containing radical SAM protein [Pyxidicoccus parkwaysis]